MPRGWTFAGTTVRILLVARSVGRPIVETKEIDTPSVGRVSKAGGVAIERFKSVGHVILSGGVAIERSSTHGGVEIAGGIEEENSKTNGQVPASGVVVERLSQWPC